jgi:hypothetical protein
LRSAHVAGIRTPVGAAATAAAVVAAAIIREAGRRTEEAGETASMKKEDEIISRISPLNILRVIFWRLSSKRLAGGQKRLERPPAWREKKSLLALSLFSFFWFFFYF